ncbi:MAG: xanthine dehydrogenase family protein molybdopterin-binding subunit, partial [Treponema sp.]|nr:xanthine dehydrogenase family protein molybdopterin-binding subunit [Treponema sp.]
MESLPFLEDIFPPDLLYATTIRSPIAKGQLKSIQVPELPENYTFISAKDIPGENKLEGTNIPILADTTLSYIGEPIAILIGSDKETLEDLAARCEILFNEEKPIFDCNDQNNEPVLTRELVVGDTHAAFENSGKIVTGSYSTGIQEHWYAEPVGAVCWLINEQGGKGAKAK